MPTNHGGHNNASRDTGDYKAGPGDIGSYPNSGEESAKLGYETTDVNVGGVAVFLAGLFGFVLIFFVFCYLMGRTINTALEKQDGPTNKWHQQDKTFAGASANGGKTENLKSSAAMEQQEFQHVAQSFPGPRLQMDDGNQDTADLHAREDLLLNHYSTMPGQPGVRIPIDRAMELIVAHQLPVVAPVAGTMLAGDKIPTVLPPLTSGFARTGYELDTIEARQQKLNYSKAEEHAEVQGVR